nr:hypothetical protein [Escherichia coli]
EQIGAQFVWREGISPHEAEFTVPRHRHFTFRNQIADNPHIRFGDVTDFRIITQTVG